MKVKELVAKLKSYNQDARVIIQSTTDKDGCLIEEYAYGVGWCYTKSGETDKTKVIIE
jgi:hypothetical protein